MNRPASRHAPTLAPLARVARARRAGYRYRDWRFCAGTVRAPKARDGELARVVSRSSAFASGPFQRSRPACLSASSGVLTQPVPYRMDEEPDRSRFRAMRAMPERVLARSRDARVALRAFGRREPPPFPQASGYAFHGCDVLQRAMRWWAAPTACRRPGRNEQRTTVSEHPRGGRLPGAVRELETEGGSCARRTIGRAGVSPPMPRMPRMRALIDRQAVVIDDFGWRMETDLAPPGALFTGDAGLPEDGAAAPEPDSPRTAPARPARHSTRGRARITDRHRERRDADADRLRPPP